MKEFLALEGFLKIKLNIMVDAYALVKNNLDCVLSPSNANIL